MKMTVRYGCKHRELFTYTYTTRYAKCPKILFPKMVGNATFLECLSLTELNYVIIQLLFEFILQSYPGTEFFFKSYCQIIIDYRQFPSTFVNLMLSFRQNWNKNKKKNSFQHPYCIIYITDMTVISLWRFVTFIHNKLFFASAVTVGTTFFFLSI